MESYGRRGEGRLTDREATFERLCDWSAASARFVIVMGMAKTGTTLPLTLLDGHPDLCVFPEELRFFHADLDFSPPDVATNRLLEERNIQELALGAHSYDDYATSMGTGFGPRDYSNLDFTLFGRLARWGFNRSTSPYRRLVSVHVAYEMAKREFDEAVLLHGDIGFPIFVSKAPHNELYLPLWQQMMAESRRPALFIRTVRNPVDHYWSQLKAHRHVGRAYPHKEHAALCRSRERMASGTPDMVTIRYEDLTSSPEHVMRRLATDLDIRFVPSLLQPTKNGVPWHGNPSKGDGKPLVYTPIDPAAGQLDDEIVEYLELALEDLYDRQGYARSHSGDLNSMSRVEHEMRTGWLQLKRRRLLFRRTRAGKVLARLKAGLFSAE